MFGDDPLRGVQLNNPFVMMDNCYDKEMR